MVAVRKHLPSLTGFLVFFNREPSHKWLGYCQNRAAQISQKKDLPAFFKICFIAPFLEGRLVASLVFLGST
jgi:hypothetical protein